MVGVGVNDDTSLFLADPGMRLWDGYGCATKATRAQGTSGSMWALVYSWWVAHKALA